MIYVTGHMKDGIRTIQNLKTEDNKTLGEGDKLIICGDCLYFHKMPWYSDKKPYDRELDTLELEFKGEIFLILGRNEIKDMIEEYPIISAYGGSMKKVRNNFFVLENGEFYDFDGKSFFVMCGGYKPGISLSPAYTRSLQRALPTDEELFCAIRKFEGRYMKCDYIISHTAPFTMALIFDEVIFPEESMLLSILDYLFDKGEYKQWYFGRYEKDKSTIHSKVTACWNKMYLINNQEEHYE